MAATGRKVIQEQFGDAVISAVADFCRKDIKTVSEYNTQMAFIADANYRDAVSRTLYGARWIYKIGLALLVNNDEEIAHVRAQIIDYAAVCEGLLAYTVAKAIEQGIISGSYYKSVDRHNGKQAINWNRFTNKVEKCGKLGFFWCIKAAFDSGIILQSTHDRLDTLRKKRNSVHLPARTAYHYINVSKDSYGAISSTANDIKQWLNTKSLTAI